MINIGVLSAQKRKGKLIQVAEKNIEEIKFTVAEISYPNCKIALVEKLLSKVLTALAKRILKSSGAEIILNESPDCNLGNVEIPLTDEYVKRCASETAERMEFTDGAVYLLDKDMEFTDYNLLVNICLKTKNLCIITDNISKTEYLCEELNMDYGIYPDIYDYSHKIPYRAETVIDFDNRRIKLNSNIIIDGVILMFDIDGLNLDFSYLIGIYPEIIRYASFKSWTSGKNQLTMGLC